MVGSEGASAVMANAFHFSHGVMTPVFGWGDPILTDKKSAHYLGQYWQRRPLADLNAVVYPAGRPVDYPAALALDSAPDADRPWRLFVVVDTRAADCQALLRHFALVYNRLANRPDVQAGLRLTVLAFDSPDQAAIQDFLGGIDWAERHAAAISAFGRFPARNAALGRDSTPEEAAFLERHPSGF